MEDMGNLRCSGLRHGDVNKILAVDSLYHVADKTRFLQDAAKLLPENGLIAYTDVVVSGTAPFWVRASLEAMNIPCQNHWTFAEYRFRLEREGFEVEILQSLEPYVLHEWLPPCLTEHLDYVLVSAHLKRPPRRPKCAIVGSGMSGCLVARLLSETHEVKVFEAEPNVSLAGRAIEIDGVTVDVPLRMIAPHYYSRMITLVDELGVETAPTRFDACFYNKLTTLFVTHIDAWKTLAERMKYVGTLIRLTVAIFAFPPDETTSFGDYAKKHAFRDTEVYQIFILPQLSWMLSCDLAMVEAYPATAVNGFLKAINPLVSFSKGIVRITPSNKVLQDALIKGIDVQVNTPVKSVGSDLSINGEQFDAVVIATEAGAVPKILKDRDWAKIFGDFKYHPSSVVLHRDVAILPQAPSGSCRTARQGRNLLRWRLRSRRTQPPRAGHSVGGSCRDGRAQGHATGPEAIVEHDDDQWQWQALMISWLNFHEEACVCACVFIPEQTASEEEPG